MHTSSKSLFLSIAISLFSTFSFFSVASVFAQSDAAPVPPFEGTITYSVSTPAMGTAKTVMRTNIKGNKINTEIDMGAIGTQKLYIDEDKKLVLSVVEARKIGYEVDIPQHDSSTYMSDFKATGKTQMIDGYNSQEYTGSVKNMMYDIWATPELPAAVRAAMQVSMLNNAQNSGSNGFRTLAAQGLAPVSMTLTMNGNRLVTMQLEKFEQKSLSDALFVPAPNLKITHLTPEQVKQYQQASPGNGGN